MLRVQTPRILPLIRPRARNVRHLRAPDATPQSRHPPMAQNLRYPIPFEIQCQCPNRLQLPATCSTAFGSLVAET